MGLLVLVRLTHVFIKLSFGTSIGLPSIVSRVWPRFSVRVEARFKLDSRGSNLEELASHSLEE